MDRSTAIKNWNDAQFDTYDYTQHKAQRLAIAHGEMRPFVSDSESLDALKSGITCAHIGAALADVEAGFEPKPHYYTRRSWFGCRVDAQTSIVRPGDEAMHRVDGPAVDALVELVEAVRWGQVGASFVTNRQDGWTSDRILTLYVNRRPRFVVYDRDSGITAYLIPADMAEWIFAIERNMRQRAEVEYARRLREARAAVDAAYRGEDGPGWHFEPGQRGGIVRGPWGTVSANGAGVAEADGIDLLSNFSSRDVVDSVRR